MQRNELFGRYTNNSLIFYLAAIARRTAGSTGATASCRRRTAATTAVFCRFPHTGGTALFTFRARLAIYNSKTTSIESTDFVFTNVFRIDIIDESIDDINNIVSVVKSGNRFEGKEFTNGNLNREV